MVSQLERPARRKTAAEVAALFAAFQTANPHPTTELAYGNAYQLLIAVVMSAQTTDVAVNKATATFFPQIQTPQAMLAWGEDNLKAAIRTIGLYQTKAKNVIALSKLLLERHGGTVPHEMAALEALPGVGRKTASVVANTLWGAPVVAVDTHVFRVARRLGLAAATTPDAMAAELPKRIPPAYVRDAHHWLILHGRYTCRAIGPRCPQCPVEKMCQSSAKHDATHSNKKIIKVVD
ncbi:MAG: endonuclease III [Alphaproteobacteria bacterium]|jgi:endonuclease-3|nr:endonuclease III [Alphaproteobacteria bacterium]